MFAAILLPLWVRGRLVSAGRPPPPPVGTAMVEHKVWWYQGIGVSRYF